MLCRTSISWLVAFAGNAFAQPPAPTPAPAPAEPQAQPTTPPAPEPSQSTTPAEYDEQRLLDETLIKAPKSGKTGGKTTKKERPKVKLSGFLTQQYEFRIEQNDDGQKDPDGFRIGKAVVRVEGDINRWVGYQVEVDPRSPTLAGVMRDGYITVNAIPKHEIRIGQQKVPWGYENWLPSTQLYTHHRSELSEGIGRGLTHRDIGIGLVGKVKLAEAWRFEDAVALVNGAGFGVQADDTTLKNLWGRVGVRYENSDLGIVVHAGVSGAYGDQIEPEDPGPPPEAAFRFKFKRIGGDLEVDHRWAFFGAEYGRSSDQVLGEDPETSWAYFVLLAGKTPWRVGPVVKFEDADPEFRRLTIGGYYGEPKDRFRVHLGYESWEDDVGAHDGRVVAQALVVF